MRAQAARSRSAGSARRRDFHPPSPRLAAVETVRPRSPRTSPTRMTRTSVVFIVAGPCKVDDSEAPSPLFSNLNAKGFLLCCFLCQRYPPRLAMHCFSASRDVMLVRIVSFSTSVNLYHLCRARVALIRCRYAHAHGRSGDTRQEKGSLF